MAQPGDEAAGRLRLADKAMEAGDIDGVVAHLSAAVRGFTAAGEVRAAAVACSRLGFVYGTILGNRVAARPWSVRAERLLEGEGPCIERGWVALAPMGCDVDDPAELLARAELALDMARRFGDVDLEVKALADGGLAHVEAGRLAEGMAMIDEAMALICGGALDDVEVAGRSVCSFFTACYYTGDLGRVEAWRPGLRQRGLIGGPGAAPAILGSHCDSVHAALLCHLGRFREAEELLERALEKIQDTLPAPAMWIHPVVALADLRILQGRLAEAEALLLGRDDLIEALLPTARLHLARGDHDLARATATRGLRLIGDDRVRAALLLGIVAQAELGLDDTEAAARASADLDARITGLALPAVTAEAARVRALVHAARGDSDAAIADLHEAALALTGSDLPRLRAAVHLELARAHLARGERASSVVAGRVAAAALRRVDVVIGDADVALLRELGADVGRPESGGEACRVAALVPDGTWWTASCGPTNVRLRDTKGLRYLAELIARPGVERHVLDLVDLVEGVGADGEPDRRRLGDAGEMLDPQAKARYRRRIEELREEIDHALLLEDDARGARAQAELDALVGELARAVGLGGRDRKASATVEKARLNVTRALRSATAKLVEALPGAGDALDRRIRTGVFCAYEPQPSDNLLWSVQHGMNGSRPR